MLEDHIVCPKCGYDLHGIPAVRCPECGFRYDAAALKSVASSMLWTRIASGRDVTVRSAIAIVLALPAVCDRLGIFGLRQLLLVGAAYLAAFVTWFVATEAYRDLGAWPRLMAMFFLIGLLFRFAASFAAWPPLIAGAVVMATAWSLRLRHWPVLLDRSQHGADDVYRSVDRYSVAATWLVVVATIVVVFALVG